MTPEICTKCGRGQIPSTLLHAAEISGGAAVANSWLPLLYTSVICLLPSGVPADDLTKGIDGWCDITIAIHAGKSPEETNKLGSGWHELYETVRELDWHTTWLVEPDLCGWTTVLTTAITALLRAKLFDKEGIMVLVKDAVQSVEAVSTRPKEGRVSKMPESQEGK
jgi:hypothetical protein